MIAGKKAADYSAEHDRIVQEALTNTMKHGGPDARADVTVEPGELGTEVDPRSPNSPGPGCVNPPGHCHS